MKKLITTLVMLLSVVSIQAQSVKELSLKVDSLQLKFEKLQRDYNYLNCEYKLNKLHSYLQIFIHDLKITTDQIITNGFNNNYTDALYNGFKRNHEEYLKSYESHKSLIWSTAYLVSSIIENSNFYEQEIKVLKSIGDAIDQQLKSAKLDLDYQKELLDVYKNMR